MKTPSFLLAALLGCALSRPAAAQVMPSGTAGTPTNGTIGTPATASPGSPVIGGTGRTDGLPTGVPAGQVPTNATTPTGISGPLYPKGVPTRNVDGGTQRADQPMGGMRGGMPATTGSQPTKTLRKGRRSGQ
ncbi:MAG: hypothetical protein ACRYFX_16815 [Janthinobacterium lividum]